MITYISTSFKNNSGKPRIWIEGRKLAVAFNAGDKYRIDYNNETRVVELIADPNGTETVNKRTKKDIVLPLIELREKKLEELYEYGVRLTVKVKKGRVTCAVDAIDAGNRIRAEEFRQKILAGGTIDKATAFTGGGLIDKAIHEGLKLGGIDSKIKLVIESEEMYLESFLRNQSDLLADDAIICSSKIEEINFDDEDFNFTVDVLLCTLPCTGASLAGRTSNKLKTAEHHTSAGAAFYYALNMVKKFKPVCLVIENVKEFCGTATFAIITSVLENWGFSLSEKILNGNEFSALENRDRLCLVANLKQLREFDFTKVIPLEDKAKSLREFIEDVPADDPSWRKFEYLKTKLIRDKAKGSGFSPTLYNGDEEKIITIRRTYHKAGSCDPYMMHPSNPELSRLFTPKEHAHFKTIPFELVDGNSNTIQHELLGQSGCYLQFVSVGLGLAVNYLLSAGKYGSCIQIKEGINVEMFNKLGKHAKIIERKGRGFILLTKAATEFLISKGCDLTTPAKEAIAA